ncbi:MAG: NADP-dependent malic enzyme [Candidatus Undinarchaeales archaeon]|jgi:malate dehydrogenase (oxaloacetate-decarboxylating)|nr:NADP-dependent malic enzyme [Candidatus Undinarchaeales archaeon]MDP7494010.1 NADP-dependent malic enzyme [Candidatus Undinarchaeales archaeon]
MAGDGTKKVTKEELLAKAYKPAQDAKRYHPFYRGKIEMTPKCVIRDLNDFGIWYTPGVAEPCLQIKEDPLLSYELTNRWNTIAIVSDGTRVLGLGDIGPEAAMPVMEGKALIFKYLGGVDAVPICLDTKDPDAIIETVKLIQPSFGGINLEDIANPKCFYILDRLREEAEIPIWHDDQQGTATIVVAGVINALKLTGRKMEDTVVSMVGAGAANIAISRMLVAAGITKRNIIMCDSKGVLHPGRTEFEGTEYEGKWDMCLNSNSGGRTGDMAECIRDTDVLVASSRPGPGIIKKEMIAAMNEDAVVFTCANPIPEIWPWEAKEAGAVIVATGRSDFPNQANNSLGFPGIFRGTLDVRATTITDEMCIAAALEIAKTAEDRGLSNDHIVPDMTDWEVFPREALAVGMKAMEQGIARNKVSRQELYEHAESIIRRAREQTALLMKEGFIPPPPPDE